MIRTSAAFGVLLLAACFQPVPVGDCLRAGLCECLTASDCDAGLDCVDGRCVRLPDAGPLDELGAPCMASADCDSGICLPRGPGNGSVCSVQCEGDRCPKGWECKPLEGRAVCVPPLNPLCLACEKDSDCNAAGDVCLRIDGEGRCGRDCSMADCPVGYVCLAVDAGLSQCVPASLTCECSQSSIGLKVACSRQNGFGRCFGARTCEANGDWSSCDARTPAPEVCNGIDDDCDGLSDQDDSSLDTSGLPTYPTCRKGDAGICSGLWACLDGGFVCTATEPRPESCNGLDDDCDGLADEPFIDGQGRYVDAHHCGACGFDCDLAIPNVLDGGSACEIRAGAPSCVPKRCAPGFYPYPEAQPITCRALVSSSCRPCSSDADCSVASDRCVTVGSDPGTFCAQSCESTAPYGCQGLVGQKDCCPSGYTCQLQGGAKLCIPDVNSCTCSSARQGATRSCFVGAPPQSCVGVQTCGPIGWSTCSTITTTPELCDSLDNDCDGTVDEDFIGTRGASTYDTDEHCGSCSINCKSMWSPTLQHAIGGCDAGPGRAPTCQIVRCTSESVPGGGTCRLDSECPIGFVCDPLYRQCARACQSSADCGGQSCVQGRCTLSCTSNAQCAQLGAPAFCGDGGVCVVSYQFVDADREATNGCECPAASGVADEPEVYSSYPDAGWPYVDRDCDGVDGEAASSLFVWAQSPQSLGTRQNPYRTIGEALRAFDATHHRAILVAAGSYVETVVLKNGVKLYGGYSSDFFRRDVVAFPTLIEGPEPSAANTVRGVVNAENITAPTVLAGFTVRGYDVTFRPPPGSPGRNSYAIYVKNSSSALLLANNRVVAGRGGDGAPGSAGQPGANGGEGGDGLDSRECTDTTCAGQSQPGGAAGVNPSCPSANGVAGASSSGGKNPQDYQPPLWNNGRGGENNTYAHSSPSQNNLCKYDCIIGGQANGSPAVNGQDGIARAPGSGCMGIGSLVGDEWRSGVGANGTDGTHAQGGGGGGAGGVVVNQNPPGCTVGNRVGDLGATGGGGGAGGCGGQGGQGGGGGGASFGIFIVGGAGGTFPRIEGNFIEIGFGGAGGNGGPGGYGGLGGQGGEGGVAKLPAWCAGHGGRGGRGGNGGAGAGGGGGCGGVAYGIAGVGITGQRYDTRNRFGPVPVGAPGAPGAGGASPAGAAFVGGSGERGVAGAYREL